MVLLLFIVTIGLGVLLGWYLHTVVQDKTELHEWAVDLLRRRESIVDFEDLMDSQPSVLPATVASSAAAVRTARPPRQRGKHAATAFELGDHSGLEHQEVHTDI
jgi:hypothetical protein